MKKEPPIEAGLLPTFRILTGIRLLLAVLALVTQAQPTAGTAPSFPLLSVIESGVLMLFLASPVLRRWMGRAYLPTAFLIATVGPILVQNLTVWGRMAHGYLGQTAYVDPGSLLFVLIIPLVLLSSQYGLKTLIVYCLGSAALEIVLAIPAANNGGPALKQTSDWAIILTIIYMLVGYVVVRLMSAQRAQRRELAEANVKLAEYANTLEQLAISRERNRMARELHDTLAHTLTAVSIQLEALDALWESDPQAARKTLSLSRDLTRSGVQETRRALTALRSSPLEDLGLALAIRHLAETTATRAGLQLCLDVPPEVGQLPPFTEQGVYRIAEEALNNTARHANAHTLSVSLKRDTRHISLQLVDDGLGFDPGKAAQDGHFGLVGMRERAALCNGTLRIDSVPGKGTQVQFTVVEP